MKILVVGLSFEHLGVIQRAMDFDSDYEFTPEVDYVVYGSKVPRKLYHKAWLFGVWNCYHTVERWVEDELKRSLSPSAVISVM